MPNGDTQMENSQASSLKDLPRPQKIAVIIFAVLALVIVVFWIWQIRAQINRPFASPGQSTSTTTDIDLVLQSRDTDGDGLSDYDEIYVNKTSPYLEDSDSDGILDKAEILQGSDPNCPYGKDCSAGSGATTATSSAAVDNNTALDVSGLDEASLQNMLSGSIGAADLRQILLTAGMKKEDLDKISDADLIKSYQDNLQASASSTTP